MTSQPQTFQDLLTQLDAGSEEAAQILLDQYGRHVVRAVRRHLKTKMRREFDSVDFAQQVWSSFFAKRERLENFEEPQQLLGYLQNMAKNKILEADRTVKRSKNREEEELEVELSTDEEEVIRAEILNDIRDIVREDFSERDGVIFRLLLQGRAHKEIADLLKVHERSIRRIRDRMVARLKERTLEKTP